MRRKAAARPTAASTSSRNASRAGQRLRWGRAAAGSCSGRAARAASSAAAEGAAAGSCRAGRSAARAGRSPWRVKLTPGAWGHPKAARRTRSSSQRAGLSPAGTRYSQLPRRPATAVRVPSGRGMAPATKSAWVTRRAARSRHSSSHTGSEGPGPWQRRAPASILARAAGSAQLPAPKSKQASTPACPSSRGASRSRARVSAQASSRSRWTSARAAHRARVSPPAPYSPPGKVRPSRPSAFRRAEGGAVRASRVSAPWARVSIRARLHRPARPDAACRTCASSTPKNRSTRLSLAAAILVPPCLSL